MPYMERMTWRDVEEYLSQRKDVMIPVGSVEEHGLHLPISTDYIIAEELSKAAAERSGILIAPPIYYGVCRHTAGYPGTINIGGETLRRLIGDLIEDYNRHGFQTFYILTGHAGTVHMTMLREGARGAALKLDIQAFVINPFELAPSEGGEAEEDVHAGDVETSLMLYLRPDLVDLGKSVGGRVKRERFRLTLYERPTESGVFGDPSKASESKGKRLFQRLVEEIPKFIAANSKF